ncbi:glycosyltransferase family 4 protein [Methylorubrum suomiense]|uniref:D-inositol-3-phosphate glycosyltransferase n=1 Tax=Methylorubrum suomiense TaxID=144191 RepID=A0ABQ4UX63_9HYPH|nr:MULTISPECIES: glycosyltransferase family 4 protein [Methylobacteriaceae]GJE75647.1 D-inositol-3-phosphate glycosyltransferase [Methylorubrum suomiense]
MIRKVLLVHNAYRKYGGEDTVVAQEEAALRRAGCEVQLFTLSNTTITSFSDKMRAALTASNAPGNIGLVLDAVRAFEPDLVHIHNFFPMISPMVHAALQRIGVPTVQTLHNYRVICAGATLNRNGSPCEICITRSPYHAVVHRCYRGSLLGSLAVAHSVRQHRRLGTWSKHVDRFIVLTEFERSRFVAAGLPAERIKLKPNGLSDNGPGPARRRGLLFVGRLTREKGVHILAQAAERAGHTVEVLGEGPLQPLVEASAGLVSLGHQTPRTVRAAIAQAVAIVVPSVWYEGLPMVIVEAFSAGTPVIVSRTGSLAEVIEDGVTGLHAEPGDAADLARVMDRMLGDPAAARRMGEAARRKYERDWSEATTTRQLLAIYDEAVASHATTRAAAAGACAPDLTLA